jgi:hypothetical protein
MDKEQFLKDQSELGFRQSLSTFGKMNIEQSRFFWNQL